MLPPSIRVDQRRTANYVRGASLPTCCRRTATWRSSPAPGKNAGVFLNQVIVPRPFALPTSRQFSHARTVVTILHVGTPGSRTRFFHTPADMPIRPRRCEPAVSDRRRSAMRSASRRWRGPVERSANGGGSHP